MELKNTYESRITRFSDALKATNRRLRLLSRIRVTLFVIAIVSAYYLASMYLYYALLPLVICGMPFGLSVKSYIKELRRKKNFENLLQINHEEIERIEGRYLKFPPGSEYIDINHPYTFDLDIFGEGSLYQFIKRTTTNYGSNRLSTLLGQWANADEIKLRQDAVRELAPMLDDRQNLQAIGMSTDDISNDLVDVADWFQSSATITNRRNIHLLLLVFPAITITLLVLCLIIGYWILFAGWVVIQYFVFKDQWSEVKKIRFSLTRNQGILGKYYDIISWVGSGNFRSAKLSKIKATLGDLNENESAAHQLQLLTGLMNKLDWTLNLLLLVPLNVLLLWDLQCYYRMEKWKEKNRENVFKWFEAMGEIEAISSLGCFSFNHPEFIMPEVFDERRKLISLNLGHPLIPRKDRICNDLSIKDGEIVLITGANMAGKSTFLRTVGINLVLAMSGAPCCATKFQFKPVNLFTSMRITDSLKKGESTFKSELLRLKLILDVVAKDSNVFFLLDEILKGTNSEDQHTGSKAVVTQMIKKNGTGMVATHDIGITKLEKLYPENIRNCSFDFEWKGSDIVFDYILKDGICKHFNARDLMKSMGVMLSE